MAWPAIQMPLLHLGLSPDPPVRDVHIGGFLLSCSKSQIDRDVFDALADALQQDVGLLQLSLEHVPVMRIAGKGCSAPTNAPSSL